MNLGPKRHAVSLIHQARGIRANLAPKNLYTYQGSKRGHSHLYRAESLDPVNFGESGASEKHALTSLDLNRGQSLFKTSGNRHGVSLVSHKRYYHTSRLFFKPKEDQHHVYVPSEGNKEAQHQTADKKKVTAYGDKEYNTVPYSETKDPRILYYFVTAGTKSALATGARLAVLKFLYSWSASAKVLALASVEVDLSPIPRGKTIIVTWRGKPVFIKHRTFEDIERLRNEPIDALRDPQLDSERTTDENWTVCLAVCTHLGCVPISDAGGWPGGFFCPCHGSHYDVGGRIRAGPAPLNLTVPPFTLTGDTLVLG